MNGLAAALLIATLAACGPIAATPAAGTVPTDVEARSLLSLVVDAAQRRDFAALCAYGDANCVDVLEAAGRDRVPLAPPHVVGTRQLPPTDDRFGGLVLQLCGLTDDGQVYRTEMLILRTGAGLKAVQPIYWSGMRVPADGVVGADGRLDVACS